MDMEKYAHTNIDIVKTWRHTFPIYNPFTPDVKPRVAMADTWRSTDGNFLYGTLIIKVTDPDTGKNLYFEFAHLTAAHRENGLWIPENKLWEKVMNHGYGNWEHEIYIPVDSGQLLGYVSNPKTDPWSNAYHIQFGQRMPDAVANPYTAALQVYFMTHQADKYRPAWEEEPSGSGF